MSTKSDPISYIGCFYIGKYTNFAGYVEIVSSESNELDLF